MSAMFVVLLPQGSTDYDILANDFQTLTCLDDGNSVSVRNVTHTALVNVGTQGRYEHQAIKTSYVQLWHDSRGEIHGISHN
jgi:hypothetical protein